MPEETLKWVIPVALSIFAGLWGVYRFLSRSIAALADRMSRIETKVEIFWKVLGDKASLLLHSPHTPGLDELLEKYQREELSSRELDQLAEQLRAIEIGASPDHPDKADHLAAGMLLLAMQQRYHL